MFVRFSGGALALALATALQAQPKPYTQAGTGQPVAPPAPAAVAATSPAAPPAPAPEPGAVEKLFNGKIPDAIAKGKFNLDVRLRYEFVDQDGTPTVTEQSHAPTIRTRFGYTTAPLYGFQGMLEGENIAVLGPEHNYNAAGSNGENNKPVVADPPTTELNQAWLSYTYTNWVTVKGGRQRLALDNQRFVGDVAWRQNMQTFDAATAQVTPVQDVALLYGYLWAVNRVFGDVDNLPAANEDFDSQSHVVNVVYNGCKLGRFVGYAYLLDLENAAGNANSCATYGGFFAGSAALNESFSLGYRAEAAFQTDYADSPQDYQAEYYNIEMSGAIQRFSLGAGYEVLGTDSNDNGAGSVGFRTPLATLHAFNGWADVFLNTPAKGLRDAYVFAQVLLPAQMPLRAVYHKFEADSGDADLGQELDVQLSKKFGKHWAALLKYAYFNGVDAPAAYDVHKFWAQVEFNF